MMSPASTETATSDRRQAWLDRHAAWPEAGTDGHPDLLELRRRGIESFSRLGFPTTREEEWRFTNVTPLAATDFHYPMPLECVTEPEEVGTFSYINAHQLVFLNGFFCAEYSTLYDLPPGVRITSLKEALADRPDEVLAHLGKHLRFEDQTFAALNTAHLREGAFVSIGEGEVLSRPLHLLFLSTESREPAMSWPRNLIVMGPNSQATIIESFASGSRRPYLTGAVSEIVVGDYAVLEHYKVQQEGLKGWHMATTHFRLGRSSTATSQNISLGGGFVRNDTVAELMGEGGDLTLNGLYLTRGTQFVDNHMRVEHVAPSCHSYELYKGILEEKSRAVFSGLIHVHPGAQQTDGKQANRNLILSPEALVNTNPQLLIYADDVKCTHGSTVGQLDKDAVFYLRSRGIGEDAARSLLIYAFASEFVEKIRFEPLRRDLEEFLFTRLPKGDIVRQAV
jgi:Fe-S cluster assembly protein SufD